MWYADRVGLRHVAARLRHYAEQTGDESLRPAGLLARLADDDGTGTAGVPTFASTFGSAAQRGAAATSGAAAQHGAAATSGAATPRGAAATSGAATPSGGTPT
jgi:hypothetical protein